MVEQNSLTPEKQLLKLIEEQPKQGEAQTNLKAATIKHRGLSFVSLGAWMGRVSFFRVKLKDWFSSGRVYQFDIKLINKILVVGIVILVFYVASTTYVSFMNLRRPFELKLQGQLAEGATSFSATPLLKAPAYYLEKARQRELFRMVPKKKEVEEALSGPSARLMEATKDLRLVGISWSKEPDIMIEDTQTKSTYFLKRGETFANIRVEAIYKDKVILSFEGEEVELK